MARMIPSHFPMSDPKYRGEKGIFDKLKDDPGTEGWIVLHSLDISTHVRNLEGEADFVILVPDLGILCLEVKGTNKVRRTDDGWFYGASNQPDKRGPFKQASEAMHSIRNFVSQRAPHKSNILFWSAVAFPFIDFEETSDEWWDWQVMSSRGFKRPISKMVIRVLNNAREHVADKNKSWLNTSPTHDDLAEVANILRPRFEILEAPSSRRNRVLGEAKTYTDEQFTLLDQLSLNRRLIVNGPAGTGKTFMAMEAARRALLAGDSVLFLCYNRLLADWITTEMSDSEGTITVRNLHRLMTDLVPPTKNTSNDSLYFESELPLRAIDTLLDGDESVTDFDVLIVDEVQDFSVSLYLDFLDLCLRGGLSTGSWYMFGDFNNQQLFGNEEFSILESIKERCDDQAAHLSLASNCRNTPEIVEYTSWMTGRDSIYKETLRDSSDRKPSTRLYSNELGQRKLFQEVVEELRKLGLTLAEITVLSPKAASVSLACRLESDPDFTWHNNLKHRRQKSSKDIGYASIKEFKGLESMAVIVTDIEEMNSEEAQDLLYVAFTRSTDSLYLLAHKNIESYLYEKIRLMGNS